MILTRVIPVLLLKDNALIKTIKFNKENYIGSPINAIRIFNGLEVDELIFLDIFASRHKSSIKFDILRNIADECFMPMTYGGGIKTIDDMATIFQIGFEKISLNTVALKKPIFIEEAAKRFGSQSVVVSIDIKRNFFGKKLIFSLGGKFKPKITPVEWARKAQELGAGELLINSVDQDGTWDGYDIDMIKEISDSVSIPVISAGGAGSLSDFKKAIHTANASAVAAGSMFVFQKKGMGVLINYPPRQQLEILFSNFTKNT